MKILKLISANYFGGAAQVALMIYQTLQEAGHEVKIAVRKGGYLRDIYEEKGLDVIDICAKRWWNGFRFAKLIKKENFDIIHSHLTDANNPAILASLLTKRPVVSHAHGNSSNINYRFAAKRGTLVVPSHALAEHYLKKIKIPEKLITVLPNAVTAHLHPSVLGKSKEQCRKEICEELNIPENAKIVTTAGRITHIKGQDLFLQTAQIIEEKLSASQAQLSSASHSQVRPENKNTVEAENQATVFYLIAGDMNLDPEYSDKLRKMAIVEKLGARCKFLGFRQDLPKIISASDVIVVPSTWETLSIVTMEAMILAVPVVAADVGGMREEIVKPEFGIILPERKSELFADAIIEILTNLKIWKKYSILAQKYALKNFTTDVFLERLLNLYRTVSCKFE